MPISDRYQLIFIHIPKCAGISVWNGLDLSICPCNLISTTPPVLQHLLPKQLKGHYISQKKWKNYTKFTIIRDPYDRVVSDYHWLKTVSEEFRNLSFDELLTLREDVVKNNRYSENLYFDHFYPMYFYFEEIEYDFVLRFENLAQELPRIKKLYKIEKSFSKTNQTEHSSFILSDEQRERIYALYERDFSQFGYPKEPFTLSDKNASENAVISSSTVGNPKHLAGVECLQQTKLQIFWSDVDANYSEALSSSITARLEENQIIFNLFIPQLDYCLNSIRLDIGNEAGLLNMHMLRLKNKNGQVIWEWNKNVHTLNLICRNFLLLEYPAPLNGRWAFFSLNDDPQLYITLSNEMGLQIQDGGSIEVELSRLSAPQMGTLLSSNYLPAELLQSLEESKLQLENKYQEQIDILNVKENECKELEQRIEKQDFKLEHQEESIALLKTNKVQLEKTIGSNEITFRDFQDELNAVRVSLSDSEERFQNASAEREQMKDALSSIKNEVTSLNHQLEIKEIILMEKREQFELFHLQVTQNMELVAQKENVYQRLLQEKTILTDNLKETDQQRQQLIQEKESLILQKAALEVLLTKLNMEISEELKNNERLSKGLKQAEQTQNNFQTKIVQVSEEKQAAIQQIMVLERTLEELKKSQIAFELLVGDKMREQTVEFIRKREELGVEMNQIIRNNQVMEERNKVLESKVELFRKQYTLRNSFQIMFDRLTRKEFRENE